MPVVVWSPMTQDWLDWVDDTAPSETVKVPEFEVGDVVLVRLGCRVLVPGEIVEGAADVDESMITEEFTLVSRGTPSAANPPLPRSDEGGLLRTSVVAFGHVYRDRRMDHGR